VTGPHARDDDDPARDRAPVERAPGVPRGRRAPDRRPRTAGAARPPGERATARRARDGRTDARPPGERTAAGSAGGRGPARQVLGGRVLRGRVLRGRVLRGRVLGGRVLTALAALLVVLALVLPGAAPTPAALVRLPVEALAGVALLLVLPARPRRAVAAVLGALLGLLAVLAVLDLGFRAVLDRPFDPVVDAPLLADGFTFLAGSLGGAAATAAAVAAVAAALAFPVLTALATRRLARVLAGHRTVAARGAAALAPVWVACAVAGAQLVPGVPVATAGATVLAADTAVGVPASLADARAFAAELAAPDPLAAVPDADLLAALRGKDVVVAFVESYGRDAVQDPEFAAVGRVLDDGTQRLAAAGFGARSGFLTAPIAGGGSWLAHATFLSGLHVDDQQRYRALLGSDRRTLTGAFARAGWETVAVMPGTTGPWPEGAFYGHDRVLDHAALGFRGPDVGWATVPDQYTLSVFERTGRGDTPVMAEIALVSSHAPWGFVPPVLDWDRIGDGAVYGPLAPSGDPDAVWAQGTDAVRAAYGRAVAYSLESLVSWVETHGDDDLVLLVLGDHQPLPVVTGEGAGRDVPISVVAADPAVLDRVAGWGWDDGLRPAATAPVWPMASFRDRFLTAFGPAPLH
jgi:hypothetical protein